MSIQRYECLGVTDKCNNGDFVLYTTHAAEVERLTRERDAAVRERDAAVEALRVLEQAEKTYREKYNTYGHNSLEARVAYDELHDAGYFARAALAKIEGGRG